MADYSVTISNGLTIYGMAPTSKWDVDKWDEFKWTTDDDLPTLFTKGIFEGLSLADLVRKEVTKAFAEAISTNDALSKTPYKGIVEGIDVDSLVDTMLYIFKDIFETVGIADNLIKTPYKGLSEGLTLTDVVTKLLQRLISNAISASTTEEVWKKRGDWYVIYGDDRDILGKYETNWQTQAISSSIWTTITVSSVSWTTL